MTDSDGKCKWFGETGKRYQYHQTIVSLSFIAQGTLIYAPSQTAQQQIKRLIAEKPTQEALQDSQTLPGIEQVSIRLIGFGDATGLSKTIGLIPVALSVV